MKILLRLCLLLLGFAAICIGASMMVFGSDATGQFFANLIGLFSRQPQELSDLAAPNVDSELRFYAVFWIAYGAILVHVARNFDKTSHLVPLLATLFFFGGIGRLLSLVLVGAPHQLFVLLMIVELVLPPALICFWFVVRNRAINSKIT